MTRLAKKLYSAEEYFALEEVAETKSEFVDGEIFPMAGASDNHLRIVRNVSGDLWLQFKKTTCEVFVNELRIQVRDEKDYTYPDIVALCGTLNYYRKRRDTITNPALIMEVLSKSTEAYDKSLKFERYKAIQTLQEYVLIRQDKIEVVFYQKQDTNVWQFQTFTNSQDVLWFNSVNAEIKLEDVYDKVDFS
jgi:Uma2 family endonuclease